MEVLLALPQAEEAMWGKAIFTRAVLRAFRKKDPRGYWGAGGALAGHSLSGYDRTRLRQQPSGNNYSSSLKTRTEMHRFCCCCLDFFVLFCSLGCCGLQCEDMIWDGIADPTPYVQTSCQPGWLALPLYGPDTRYFFPAILAREEPGCWCWPLASLQPLP